MKYVCTMCFHFSENNSISVWNNGKGIPVVEHKVEKVYVPALIFGQLLTSSNYDDDEKKVTGKYNNWLMDNFIYFNVKSRILHISLIPQMFRMVNWRTAKISRVEQK